MWRGRAYGELAQTSTVPYHAAELWPTFDGSMGLFIYFTHFPYSLYNLFILHNISTMSHTHC